MVFSSVTARLGNEGQIDYTGANDMIGKMLLVAKEHDPGKLVKIFDWTAWKGTGMAAQKTVQKVLRKRGLTFLPIETGVEFFTREHNCPKPAEVMIANEIVLPYSIGRVRFLKPIKKGNVYWCITQKTASDPKTLTYQLKLVEPDGTLCIEVADYRMVRVETIAREHQIIDQVLPWAKQKTAS